MIFDIPNEKEIIINNIVKKINKPYKLLLFLFMFVIFIFLMVFSIKIAFLLPNFILWI